MSNDAIEKNEPHFLSRNSSTNNTPNVWSIIETFIAIIAFWGATIYCENFFLLWSSICVAPLLFLRSEKHSVPWGARVFEYGFFKKPDVDKLPLSTKAFILFIYLVYVWAICQLYSLLLPHALNFVLQQTFFMFIIIVPFTILPYAITGAKLASLETMLNNTKKFGLVRLMAVIVLIIFYNQAKTPLILKSIALCLVGLVNWIAGEYLWSLTVRIIATLRFLPQGLQSMHDNVWNLAVCTSPGKPGELLPGLPETSVYHINSITAERQKRKNSGEWILWTICWLYYVIWIGIGRLYRLLLKSTLWLWWVLIVFGRKPRATSFAALEADTRGSIGSFLVLLPALFTVINDLLLHYFKPWFNLTNEGAKVIFSALLVLIDWSAFTPYQCISMITSVFKIGIFIWAGFIIADSKVPERQKQAETDLELIRSAYYIYICFIVFTTTPLLAYWLLLANAQLFHLMPISDWFFGRLQYFYGSEYAMLLRFSRS